MCGIAGFIQRAGRPHALARMLTSLQHRGPDAEGEWHGDAAGWNIALGHRRLAIIDLVDGAQPMDNEDGTVVITYNGEIYNFMDLRPVLERQGHRFKTRSDTEVVIHHYEQCGPSGIRELNGMFAFAIWDSRSRQLVLARDRAGIKPLYYAQLADGGIVFASELSALLAHGDVGTDLSVDGLVSYFFADYVHPPHAILRNVRKLLPGHTIIWKDGRLEEPRSFWSLPAPHTPRSKNERALANELWEGLGRAVESQLVADVPVGIFLSGGIDSSCVATLAAAKAGLRMKAFSIAFEDATFDESSYARMVARQLNVEHITETLHDRNLLDIVDLALDGLDEPIADPSFLPTFALSRLAARHVKVVVGGDGGDELFGGYPTHVAHRYAKIYARVPRWMRTGIVERAISALPIDERYQSLEWKLRRFTQRWDDDLVIRHLRWMSAIDLPDIGHAIPAANGRLPATLSAALPETEDWLQRILALDFSTYMPGSVLTKVDRASMAHGLEVRPPMLDNHMIEWAFSLPSEYKVRGMQGKRLLKMAATGHIPQEVIDRPKKGFGIPLATWLRGPLEKRMRATVRSSPLWDLGVLNRDAFFSWNEEHQARKKDHSKALWALFVLDHWCRRNQTVVASRPKELTHAP
jgi:asparagine synthase (glutamine-hydrolysing)